VIGKHHHVVESDLGQIWLFGAAGNLVLVWEELDKLRVKHWLGRRGILAASARAYLERA